MSFECHEPELGPAHTCDVLPTFPWPVTAYMANRFDTPISTMVDAVLLSANGGISMVPRFVVQGRWESRATFVLDRCGEVYSLVVADPGRGVVTRLRFKESFFAASGSVIVFELTDAGYDLIDGDLGARDRLPLGQSRIPPSPPDFLKITRDMFE